MTHNRGREEVPSQTSFFTMIGMMMSHSLHFVFAVYYIIVFVIVPAAPFSPILHATTTTTTCGTPSVSLIGTKTHCHHRRIIHECATHIYKDKKVEVMLLPWKRCQQTIAGIVTTTTGLPSKSSNDDDDNNDTENVGAPFTVEKEEVYNRINDQTKNKTHSNDFMDLSSFLEIPDPRLFMGDLLFLLIVNFLLQIASEVTTQEFWIHGGFFHQPITTFSATSSSLLGVIVRDSKMSIAWILSALWNRSYHSYYASISNDSRMALHGAFRVWIDYCSLRILIELGQSACITHSTIRILDLGIEVWYTAVIMTFFRWAYSKITLF